MKSLNRLPAFRKLNSAYDQLPRRDQRAVQLLSVAVALFLLYFVIWRPVQTFEKEALERSEAAVERLAWLEPHLETARALAPPGQGSTAQPINDSRSLMSTVTRSAQEAGLSLQRFEPSGERQMRVWLDNTAFDSLAGWLEGLEREYGIVVDQAALDRADAPGRVNVRLTLSSY